MSVDAILARNAIDLSREVEVERIIKAFKLNPYEILDLPVSATAAEVKKQYRKKSLLIHPDKFTHPDADKAFDFLKKAEAQLSDDSKRIEIDAIMRHARETVIKSILGSGFSTKITDDDPKLQNLKPPFDLQVRMKARDILVEDELARRRKQKVSYANEGAEKAKVEAEVNERKRKQEEHHNWEERREERIGQWREFNAKKTKKSKKNIHVLG
ncbi:chaperone regulator [Tremella mesenterica]|uniref:Chaperone regulator n=1 Tax=Tremella mesenterica TaxID=5217 RepID=A0A4Q1BWM3_TREME|nr:uncharacterized protein TREMEDRAFT_67095 [Tremella mesenterica DSM 1558]EIW72847.1 hypothetical protein TREMEDRAFT_67095 [Tremella mesenterica DSM 1558]RXK42550.1 chaperone regulator [Tremella mesenterica]